MIIVKLNEILTNDKIYCNRFTELKKNVTLSRSRKTVVRPDDNRVDSNHVLCNLAI